MKKIAITGSTGLIGSRIIELLKDNFKFIEILQSDINIADRQQTADFTDKIDFDILLHLAGFTDVDEAEKNKETVRRVNVEGTRNVFELTQNKGKKFIYISTDFVFDGKNPPYDENSIPNPLCFYAQTKYDGEKIVKDKGMIVRLAYPYRQNFELKRDFVKNVRNLASQGLTIQMVTDASITPTFIDDIAYGLEFLMNNFSPEIYHLVGSSSLSPFDAGKLIVKTFGLDKSLIQPVTFKDYYLKKAPRPQYSEIKSVKNNFYNMCSFEEGLKKLL